MILNAIEKYDFLSSEYVSYTQVTVLDVDMFGICTGWLWWTTLLHWSLYRYIQWIGVEMLWGKQEGWK